MVVSDHSSTPLNQLISYKGRRVAVTGGAKGIGAAIVGRMAEAGANVVIGDINLAQAEETARHMGARFGVICHAHELNVTDARSISDFCDATRRTLGGIDVWVNNAGLFPWSLLLDTAEATWDDVIAVNMKGVFLCSQAAGRLMIACEPDQGVIINIASMSAFRAKKGLGVYAAAKHGVVGLTRAFALELAEHRIRVMAVAPGSTATPGVARMLGREFSPLELSDIPLGRGAYPDDIARAVLFCGSHLAAYMTGQTLMVDGGGIIGDARTDGLVVRRAS